VVAIFSQLRFFQLMEEETTNSLEDSFTQKSIFLVKRTCANQKYSRSSRWTRKAFLTNSLTPDLEGMKRAEGVAARFSTRIQGSTTSTQLAMRRIHQASFQTLLFTARKDLARSTEA